MQSDVPTLSPGLRELVERAYRTREDRVHEIVECARQRFPHYRALPEDDLARVRANIDRAIGAFYLSELIEGREPDAAGLETQRRAARERLAQGVPLDELVGCYRLALPILWAHLVKCLETEGAGTQAELLQRVPVTISSNTLVTTAVTEAYVEERERRMHSHDRAVAELLRLCVDEDVPLDTLATQAHSHPLDLDVPRFGLFFRPTPDDSSALAVVDHVRHQLESRGLADDLLIGGVQDGVLALLREDAERAALTEASGKLRDRGWRIGLGGPATGAAGLRRTVREALRAVDLGARLGRAGPLDEYRELALFDLVNVGSVQATEFARCVLGPMGDPASHPTHLETLRALCANGFNRKVTAAALGIHPHTLAYRVNQIRRRYAIDVDDPETRLRVHLAMLILSA